MIVFFFKQKTAYEMRISDWSSDVCSSDLLGIVGEKILVPAEDGSADSEAVFISVIGDEAKGLPAGADGAASALNVPEPNEWGASLADVKVEIEEYAKPVGELFSLDQIGRASCRERGCQYV